MKVMFIAGSIIVLILLGYFLYQEIKSRECLKQSALTEKPDPSVSATGELALFQSYYEACLAR